MTPVASRLPAVAVWLLIAAIAVSLAYWTWRLLPLPTGTAAGPAANASPLSTSRLQTQNWFSAPGGAREASSGRYTLRWLYPGRPGVCILNMPGLQDKTFRVGEEIEPGTTLKEVGADYVVLQTRTGEERLRLPDHNELPPTALLSPAAAPPPVSGRIPPDMDNR